MYYKGKDNITRDYNDKNTAMVFGTQLEDSLIDPYSMISGVKQMYDYYWTYPSVDRSMRSTFVVCDAVTRFVAKLHFTSAGYNSHVEKGNLKTTPLAIWQASTKKNSTITHGSLSDASALIDIAAGKTVLLVIDEKNSKNNHVGPVTRIDNTTANQKVATVIHAANSTDNMKIDYINLSTGVKYLSPVLPTKKNVSGIVTRSTYKWNSYANLSYVQ